MSDSFSQFFSHKKYQDFSGLSIISNEDTSVQFIGSTTNVFKKFLIKGDPELSYVVQPCFRANNISELLDDTSTFKWGSLFTMFGTIGRPETYSQQCDDIYFFLTSVIGIPPAQLCLQAHSDDEHLLKHWHDKSELTFEIDKQQESYYRWTYGLEGYAGRGVTLALMSNKDNKPYELGNIIEISQFSSPIAVEMGFGLECLIARINEYDHTLYGHEFAHFFNLSDNNWRKFADAILVALNLVKVGILPGARGRGRILREYIKGIVYSIMKLNVSRDAVANTLLQIEKKMIGKNIGVAAVLFNFIYDKYEEINSICIDISTATKQETINLLK